MADGPDTPPDESDLREAAIRLLARREHARRELAEKLERKHHGVDSGVLDAVLDALADDGLQSDERFAESYVRQRVDKGYGPLRIRAELAQRGIDRSDAGRALDAASPDWHAVAERWYQRRFGPEAPADLKEASRRHQALARRGFAREHFRDLLDV